MSNRTAKNTKKEISIEDRFKKKNPHEHILALPDTYIGSIDADTREMWVYDGEKMIKTTITYVPGLYKIYDEILVNARDHCVRDSSCKTIKVNINKDTGEITIWNDGNGIPIEIHKEHHVYVPELIFGNLFTSENYGIKGKIVGGKNGFGAKLANIYSTYFTVETVDSNRRKKYYQEFSDNMYTIKKPVVTDTDKKTKSYTKISFIPDFKKFGINGLTDDIINLFQKRVYDIAACTEKSIQVYLNDEKIKIASFEEYIKMFYEKIPHEPVYEELNDRWRIGLVYDSNNGFGHMSFVNGIWTFQGGNHVTHVLEQITKGIIAHIHAKNKNIKVKSSYIRDNITLYIDSVIEDPAFNSQTKEFLTTKVSNFGSKCEIDDKFIQKITKTGLIEEVIKFAQFKEMNELSKSDGKKVTYLGNIPKLDDALWAGSRKSKLCKLIVTEGDSAKAYAIAGLEVIGRDKYGVFPLRGKLLNVRDASAKQLNDNEEIKHLKQILGLKQNKKYTDVSRLRYGGILILTDQDVDGSHIKGLLINFFHYFWPSLIKIDGFIQTMSTPILKAFKTSDVKKKNPKIFYTLNDYTKWVETDLKGNADGWHVKYYKGLGTSKEKEAKESFVDFDNRCMSFVWEPSEEEVKKTTGTETIKDEDESFDDEKSIATNDGEGDGDDDETDMSSKSYDKITLAFTKKRADDRKNWLLKYDKTIGVTPSTKLTYSDFIDKELIHFSNSDNIRSIPSMCDGFKPSQRKIYYACTKKKIEKTEIKVAQLAGYIAEHTEYHHGEQSLCGAIINMAQNFVGSNNINLLVPNGNFGYRRAGGKDAASPRYIFTQLSELSPFIFRKEDEPIYKYLIEENKDIEPESYAPIIPMVLVNGSNGIGTGFSTFVPCYNVREIIDNIFAIMESKLMTDMMPWYRNFKGNIVKNKEHSYTTHGNMEIINDTTIKISDLPIGMWTETYIELLKTFVIADLKKAQKKEFIESFTTLSGNNSIDITIVFPNNGLQQLLKSNTLEKKMKLTKSVHTSNMYLYDSRGFIKKYDSVLSIIEEFYGFRLAVYKVRKEHHIKILEHQMLILKYRIQFINYVISEKIVIHKQLKKNIIAKLEEYKFPQLAINIEDKPSFDYLTGMALFALTKDKIDELDEDYNNKLKNLTEYKQTPLEKLWKNELLQFLAAYETWLEDQENDDVDDDDDKENKKNKNKKKPKRATKGTKETKETKEKSKTKTKTKSDQR